MREEKEKEDDPPFPSFLPGKKIDIAERSHFDATPQQKKSHKKRAT